MITFEEFMPFILNSTATAGKTRTAIASAAGYRDEWPVLIVCPSSARHHVSYCIRSFERTCFHCSARHAYLLVLCEPYTEDILCIHQWQAEILTVLDCRNPDSSVSAKEVTVMETSAHPLYALSANSNTSSAKYLTLKTVHAYVHTVHKIVCSDFVCFLRLGAKRINYKFVIVSYNILTKLPNLRKVFPFGVVIVDECHYMKNSGAARTKVSH